MTKIKKLTDEKLKELGLKTYIIEPRTKTFGGMVITKDTKFEDKEEVFNENDDKTAMRSVVIEQKLENFILETKITSKLKMEGYETDEVKNTRQDLSKLNKKEVLLIFVNDEGWGVPNGDVILPEKAIKTLELLTNKE